MITKAQNTKSNLNIFSLVKKNFNFDEDSLKLFKERLLYDRNIPDEYSFIKESEDLRYIKKIEDNDTLSKIDGGWDLFCRYFEDFSFFKNIKYEEFNTNKIQDGKSSIKLQKYIMREILKNKKDLSLFIKRSLEKIGPFSEELIKKSTYERFINEINENFSKNCAEEIKEIKIKSFYVKSMKEIEGTDKIKALLFCSSEIRNIFKVEKEIDSEDLLKKEAIKENIKLFFETIGRKKLPLKNGAAYFVISLNMADFMLASTAESWTSCINLESNYEGGYWAGLPGLIGDKNRAIMYFTDLSKKEFRGIKSYKMISRTWLLLGRETKSSKIKDLPPVESHIKRPYVSVVGSYPNDFGFINAIKNSFQKEFKGLPVINGRHGDFIHGKYYIENFYSIFGGDKKFTFSIYLDNSIRKIAKKNKAAFYPGLYSYYSGSGSGWYSHYYSKDTKKEDIFNSIKYMNDDLFYSDEGISNGSLEEIINSGTWEEYISDGYYEYLCDDCDECEEDW